MKTALITTALLALPLAATATEYVTLTTATPTKELSPGDLVEVTGTNMNNNGLGVSLNLNFADSATVSLLLRGKENGIAFADMKGNTFTGLTSITLSAQPGANVCATLKITPAEDISVAAPGTVLVVPDSATGDLSLVVDSSDDLVTWEQILSRGVNVESDSKFYRLRIIKNISP